MTNDERKIILSMVNDGKITAEEGLELISSLAEDEDFEEVITIGEEFAPSISAETASAAEVIVPLAAKTMDGANRGRMERSKRWWDLAAGFGILLIVGSAVGMYQIQLAYGLNFWFFMVILPLLLGVFILIIAFPSRDSKWLFIEVESSQPGKSVLVSIPLSSLVGVFNFAEKFTPPGQQGIFQTFWDAMNSHNAEGAPILINMDGGSGDRVKIFVGQ
ncbi:MAG TPA: hypothetical protein VN226_02425 [Anaerolineales bacterium]|nr:hypothetical protein [Anaerolineales bacterium]